MNAIAFILAFIVAILTTSCATSNSEVTADFQNLEGINVSSQGYIRTATEDWYPGISGEGWHATIRLQNTTESEFECLVASFPEMGANDYSKISVLRDRESVDFPRELIWVKSKIERTPLYPLWALKRYGLSSVRTEILEPGDSVDVHLPIFEFQGGNQPITNRFILEHRIRMPGPWLYTTFVTTFPSGNKTPTNRVTE